MRYVVLPWRHVVEQGAIVSGSKGDKDAAGQMRVAVPEYAAAAHVYGVDVPGVEIKQEVPQPRISGQRRFLE